MKEFNLPALEYCSLERATRFIGDGCEIEDLLHWAEIGAISLSHKFNDSICGYVSFNERNIDVAEYIFNFIEHGKHFWVPISDRSIILVMDFADCVTIDDVVSVLTKSGDKPAVKAVIKGLWDISKYHINDKFPSIYTNLSFSPSGNNNVNCEVTIHNYELGLSLNNLLVSKQAISTILGDNNKLRSLPITNDAFYLLEKEKTVNKESISNTVANNRASLIKALLAIHYGNDVADNPRKFIDNKDSEICKDFQLKGINLPSGKTVMEWLKDAEIDLT
ncbi:hypothetical protein AB6R86_004609 [Salmonella enterica]